MSRVKLDEFRPIDFASFVPEQDPNNALFPRISMAAKMLHELPWFKKSDDDDEVSEQSYDNVADIAENPKKREAFMAGLDPTLFEGMNPEAVPRKNITVEMGGMPVNVRNQFALSDDERELHGMRSDLDNWKIALSEWGEISLDDMRKDKELTKRFQEYANQNGFDTGGIDGIVGDDTIDAYTRMFKWSGTSLDDMEKDKDVTKEFQKFATRQGHDTGIDGIVGGKTRKAYKDLIKTKDELEGDARSKIFGDVEDTGEDIWEDGEYVNNLNFLSTLFDTDE